MLPHFIGIGAPLHRNTHRERITPLEISQSRAKSHCRYRALATTPQGVGGLVAQLVAFTARVNIEIRDFGLLRILLNSPFLVLVTFWVFMMRRFPNGPWQGLLT
jgi:hypothetical protein